MRNTPVAHHVTHWGNIDHWYLQFSPATANEAIKSIPLAATTPFCSFCFSLAFSLLRRRSGLLDSMTVPAINMGMKRVPINIQPCWNPNDPAGKKTNAPTAMTPPRNLTNACVRSFDMAV